MSESQFARFWSLVDIRSPLFCWEWMGPRDKLGYGVPDAGLQVAFREPFAHRIACALLRPRASADLQVREIGIKHGVTQSHADSIAKRRIWRSVP